MGLWSSIRRAMFGSEAVRAWDAAKTTRLNEAQWSQANGETINNKLGLDLVTLRNRSIDEAERNPFVEGMIETYVASVVGIDGPSLQVQSDDADFNEWAERTWWKWWESPDLNGMLAGVDLLRQSVRSLWVCGEFVWVIVADGSQSPVIRVQDVHPRRLKSPLASSLDGRMRDGVERDNLGKPLRYYIETFMASEQYGRTTGEIDPYDAENVIHGFKQREPGQVRGVPWLAPVLQTCADIRCYDEQVMDAARLSADMAILLHTDHPESTYMPVNESTNFERRTIRTAPPGWKPFQMNASQPAAQYADYRAEKLREIGRPVNMPLMMVRLDSSNHNYSSARFDGQLFSRGVASTQRWLARIGLDRLVSRVLRESAMIDEVTIPERYEKRWTWEAMPHVDPSKERSASELGLQINTTTLADECAKDGKDWEQVARQRARENKLLAELGLNLPQPLPGSQPLVSPSQQAAQPPLSPAQQRWIVEQIEAHIEEGATR